MHEQRGVYPVCSSTLFFFTLPHCSSLPFHTALVYPSTLIFFTLPHCSSLPFHTVLPYPSTLFSFTLPHCSSLPLSCSSQWPLVAVLAGLLLLRRRRRSSAQGRAPVKAAPPPKGASTSQAGGGIMDTARIQSTGGTDIPLSPGTLCASKWSNQHEEAKLAS